MSEPLEREATPLPPAIRALCFGGPWDGSVMMAPVVRTTLFGGWRIGVQVDGRSAHFRTHADAAPWIGGGYLLANTAPAQREAARQVRAVLGEPKDVGVGWRWSAGGVGAWDICVLTERMVRVHVLSPTEAEAPYEMGAALRELTTDLGVAMVEHPDGDVSFVAERPFDFRDLDRIDELLKEVEGD